MAPKKTAKGKKPSSARAAAPPRWMQGDFRPSTVTELDVEKLVADGLVMAGSRRLPGTEAESEPREGERVLLTTHLERGFSLPLHPFFRGFLNFFEAQLHHFPPNAIAYLATFVTMCECFLGCPRHWGLFKHIFTIRSQSVKKAHTSDSRTNVIQLCGGLGLQKRTGSAFPALTFPESVRGWQSTWFYCNDVASPNMSTGLPPLTLARPTVPQSLTVAEEEKANIGILMNGVVSLIHDGVIGLDLLEVLLGRRIQPLQAWDHPMWHYSGVDDTTRTHPEDVSEETVSLWLRGITGARDNPRGSKRVLPFSAEHPPNVELTNMYSPVPNGELNVEGVGSEGDSDSISYAEDSEGSGDNSEGSEEVEVISPPPTEGRSKQQQDPAVAQGQTVGSTTRSSKRTRTPTPEPTEKVAKQPMVTTTKPRKALPRIKVVVPVASTAATSVTSPVQGEGSAEKDTPDAATSRREPMDTDLAAPSPTEPTLALTQTTVELANPPQAPISPAPASQAPVLLTASPLPSQTVFSLHRVPEDQTGAVKEAMIQDEHMMRHTKEAYEASKLAYDASSALRANVQIMPRSLLPSTLHLRSHPASARRRDGARRNPDAGPCRLDGVQAQPRGPLSTASATTSLDELHLPPAPLLWLLYRTWPWLY